MKLPVLNAGIKVCALHRSHPSLLQHLKLCFGNVAVTCPIPIFFDHLHKFLHLMVFGVIVPSYLLPPNITPQLFNKINIDKEAATSGIFFVHIFINLL
jgi:hypothetical protein